LVRDVRLVRAVPVDVVGRDVEARAGLGRDRVREVELEARELDGEDVRDALGDGPDDGCPDVADGGGTLAGRREDRGEHADRRRLAVRPREGEPRRGGTAGDLEAPRELDLAPPPPPRR